jgi:hypothetical protein
MATLTSVTLVFDDPTIEADFYLTLSKSNVNDMLDKLGLASIEEIQSLTDEDRKAYVLGNIRTQLVDSYLSTKTQQLFQDIQKAAQQQPKPLVPEPIKKKEKKA